ncbi:MAG: tRNA pseudouridine(38-40) synthase TruA [Candidatus Heimdallarchaeota archaeon]|nr:tRNA pseudouridine(38-40) synthase TruA [Candidatus Heimdallarchaeota archaeon]
MRRYAIRTFYDGRNYQGYQRQLNLPTVEETLIDALIEIGYIVSPDENEFRSASRTDRYVNAIGNVFAFNSEENVILEQLNASLPSDGSIICWSYAEVSDDFTPKYSKSKKYWYVLPLNYLKTTTNMDLDEISLICSYFKGEHDYRLFCKMDDRSSIRKIDEFNLIVKEDLIIFEIEASSFLWEQVRRMVGYLLKYEKLSEKLQDTENLLQADTQITDLNLEPADPRQLILVEHFYDNIDWQSNKKAIENINKRSNRLLMRLKQDEIVVSSIHEFFKSREIVE